MTKAQLLKFIKIRNRSEYSSNLQFQIDAEECGFDPKDLGKVSTEKADEDGPEYYRWETPHGSLVEMRNKLFLVEKVN